nr:BTAD domain-containing putative transcriptional regulator [Ornithinimicrobium sp. F0845]
MPRDQVIEALWPDLGPAAGAANLRKAAFHLRRLLELPEACVLEERRVGLLPGGEVSTDVDDFVGPAERALAAGDPAGCREAAQAYRGPLLPDDPYADWAEEHRVRLRDLYLELLEAGRMWGRLVAEDPTRELAHLELMRAHLARGDRAAAIRQFGRARQVLRDELGVSPGTELTGLYERALEAEGRAAATPAMRARALLMWGGIHYERSELAEAERAAREAKALAVDAGLTTELTGASELLGLTAYSRGAWKEVFAEEFLTMLSAAPELVPFLYDANMCMVEFALGEADGLRAVSEYGAGLLAEGERSDAVAARALGRLLRGEAGVLGGEPPDAVRADLEVALELHDDIGAVTGRTVATERLAQLASVDGDPARAQRGHREALEAARASAVPQHLVPWVLGGMVEHAPDLTRAVELLDQAEAVCADLQVCAPCAMGLRVAGARVGAAHGDRDRAEELLALAEPVAQMWTGGPWHAALAEARAHLLAGSGEPAEVAAQLAAAAEQFEAAQRPREAARCRAGAAL